jgi:hypothetical protein
MPVKFGKRTSSVLSALLLAACGSERKSEPARTSAPPPAVKITQFYANPSAIAKGGKGLLCYGVESATKVRIEPPVEQLSPSIARCFEVHPAETTTYKLIADGRNGGTAEATATVTVGAAAPVLFDLAISSTKVKPGELVSFCFQAKNATVVRGRPGKFQKGGNARQDCLLDQPAKTTTYEIVASNADGLTDTASMTVQVR